MSWCINEGAIGVFTGEVGAGKTVAIRAAVANLDTSRFSVIYLPNRLRAMKPGGLSRSQPRYRSNT
jgi:type II secretory pathway predicted ATPase ExeA